MDRRVMRFQLEPASSHHAQSKLVHAHLHWPFVHRNSKASLFGHKPRHYVLEPFMTQPHLVLKASEFTDGHMQIYLSEEIRKKEMEKWAKPCPLTGLPGGPTGPVSPGIPGWPYQMYINTDLGLLPTQPHPKSRKNFAYDIKQIINTFLSFMLWKKKKRLSFLLCQNGFRIRHKDFCSNALENLEKT